ncbi:MAG: hypothetical protein ACYC8T_39560, partial [Myxococcaceae bacterium]
MEVLLRARGENSQQQPDESAHASPTPPPAPRFRLCFGPRAPGRTASDEELTMMSVVAVLVLAAAPNLQAARVCMSAVELQNRECSDIVQGFVSPDD